MTSTLNTTMATVLKVGSWKTQNKTLKLSAYHTRQGKKYNYETPSPTKFVIEYQQDIITDQSLGTTNINRCYIITNNFRYIDVEVRMLENIHVLYNLL